MKCILINCFVFVCIKNPCYTIVSFYLFIVLLWSVFILLLTMVIINVSGVNSNFPPVYLIQQLGISFVAVSVWRAFSDFYVIDIFSLFSFVLCFSYWFGFCLSTFFLYSSVVITAPSIEIFKLVWLLLLL